MRLTHCIVILLVLFLANRTDAQVEDSLVVHFKNGKTVTIAPSQIQKIIFDTLTTSVFASDLAHHLEVSPSFPNPASAATTIDFSIPESGNITITIYDSKGNSIRQLEAKNCIFAPFLSNPSQIIWFLQTFLTPDMG
jgi:hypothetical protein